MLILAGEPGGSIPATRAKLEADWHARVFDHSGMTEVGPMSIECPEHPGGLHILEEDYIVDVIDPKTGTSIAPGELGELVVTNLHRLGSPLIRYRTGDLVRVDPAPCPCGRSLLRLQGGILGRTDDMIVLRGNNFYPSALEGVIRRFAEVVEYRVRVDASSPLAELHVEIETRTDPPVSLPERLAQAIRDELLFRAEVAVVPPGSLPRFEMKAQRVQQLSYKKE
jgi:phenylacetate-CoA ligase